MAKAPPIEQQLLELSALRTDAKSVPARAKLTHALKSKNNLLAARAAMIVTETDQPDYVPLLAEAFDRFFTAVADKGCSAKMALANALYTFGYTDTSAFLRGIHHVQMEGSWGPAVDAAAELRGICALGLVRAGYREALLELAALLMDKEPQTRQMTVRAVVYADQENGALLLRMKALGGDSDADVTAETLAGLMKLTPKKSLEFVAGFLDAQDSATVESAALAIGGSRLPEAFDRLRQQWESHLRPEPRKPLLLAMAMTRQPAAVDFLLERVLDDSPRPAADAAAALGMYQHDEAVKARIIAAVTERDEPVVTEAWGKVCPR
jgi:hypothetical protein